LSTLNLAGCSSLNSIGTSSFSANSIDSLYLSDCTSLTSLGDEAFAGNSITKLDISGCSSLLHIGSSCFYNNPLTGFTLPVVSGYEELGWRDGNGNIYPGGGTATNLYTYYEVPIPYTLTDADVVVESGVITSCSYSFERKDIIIPDTLDGQEIIGIIDGAYYNTGVFYNKGIFTVRLPSAIEHIGNNAFYGNSITGLDLSVCPEIISIGNYAFYDNSIDSLKLTGCIYLTSIGSYAFRYNDLTSLDLSACSALTSIGAFAFGNNAMTNLDLSTCSALTSIGNNAFEANYSLSVLDLSGCGALTTIGSRAFYNNSLTSLDLSGCPALTAIGSEAFYDNSLTTLNLSGCTALTSIGTYAFYNNSLTSLDLSGCSSLSTIGNYAFRNNSISNLNLSGCTELISMGDQAFYGNSLAGIDLSACTKLTYIGIYAFLGNSLTGFTLPVNTEYSMYGWRDGNNNIYQGGDNVSVLNTFYEVPIPYILTDDDVVVTGGVITSCSYNFTKKDILIPDTLDGQAVTGIADAPNSSSGIFYNKGIKTIKLPATLERIGNYSFYNNTALYHLDLSGCTVLQSIGAHAFRNNFQLSNIDLSSCTALTSIESYAFHSNAISSLDLSSCTTLNTIGSYAFTTNSIATLNLSGCTALSSIGNYAFSTNSLAAIDLSGCTALTYIGSYAFANNTLTGFALPSVAGYEEYGWRDGNYNTYASGETVTNLTTYYKAAIPYTLTDDDVVVSGGVIMSCSYNFALNDIIVPDTLDSQEITGIADAEYASAGVFYKKNILSIEFPSAIKTIGDYAFYDSNLRSLDLSADTGIISIGKYAFYSNSISSLNLSGCSSITSIGNYAFTQNSLSGLDLSTCTSLNYIGSQCFASNSITSFALPVNTEYSQYGWRDGSGNLYQGGDIVTNMSTLYEVPIPYTLTDADVSITDGIITNCSYGFASSDIIIPDTLQGQAVKGIASAGSMGGGVFYNKGITSVQLPDSIESIGDYAFHTNSLFSLDLTGCSALTYIGNYAFTTNSLPDIDLAGCTSLIYIGQYAFNNNSLSGFVLPVVTEWTDLGWVDGNGNTYTGGQTVTNLTVYYKVPVPYTLTDADVMITDGVITNCSYGFENKDIIIPDTLQGQAVKGIAGASSYTSAIFYNKGITSLQLPSTLETIGENIFYLNNISKLDLSKCTLLKSIENSAFNINKISSLDLSNCTSLVKIGYAFYNNPLSGFNLPVVTGYET